jgi:hypothetical protein
MFLLGRLALVPRQIVLRLGRRTSLLEKVRGSPAAAGIL